MHHHTFLKIRQQRLMRNIACSYLGVLPVISPYTKNITTASKTLSLNYFLSRSLSTSLSLYRPLVASMLNSIASNGKLRRDRGGYDYLRVQKQCLKRVVKPTTLKTITMKKIDLTRMKAMTITTSNSPNRQMKILSSQMALEIFIMKKRLKAKPNSHIVMKNMHFICQEGSTSFWKCLDTYQQLSHTQQPKQNPQKYVKCTELFVHIQITKHNTTEHTFTTLLLTNSMIPLSPRGIRMAAQTLTNAFANNTALMRLEISKKGDSVAT